jgi:RNA 3'-terminal phosphate cyclase (GTP)
MLTIDGSYGEAGGQILRTAISLSAITKEPIKVINIRAKRPEPGLKAQHLASILAATKLCNAKLTGAKIGSTEIIFEPGKIKSGSFKFDVGTAGSVTLVLQTLVPIAAFAPGKVKLEIKGGTNVAWSPPIEFFQNIFCDYAEKFGLLITSNTKRYGFYPRGDGLVEVEIFPIKNPKPIYLTSRGKLLDIKVWSIASLDLAEAQVADRQIEAFETALGLPKENSKIKGFVDYVKTASMGSALYAHALYEHCKLGASSLGEKEKLAEKVGEEVAHELLREMNSGACVDKHMADQLIPFLGLFGGSFITSEITQHTKTNIWVTEQFTNKKFKIENNKVTAS